MSSRERIVVPGEEIATTEEFMSGEGTYEMKGRILSSYLGILKLDSEEMMARVEPINPLVELKVGHIVLAHITDVKSTMVLAHVVRVEGNPRSVSGESQSSIHVSKISQGYTSDVRNEYRLGDIIRAEVIQTKPSLQLATDRPNLGVLRSLCTKCRKPLLIKDETLFCENCQRKELRKKAPDYGRYSFEGSPL